VFCEGVQHRLRFCLDHLNCLKRAAFQFCLQSRKQKEKQGELRMTLILFLVKYSLVKRKCGTVSCLDATDSSFVAKVLGEVLANFYAVAIKRHINMRNWLCGLPGRIIWEQSP
jgi:hypothetical protein